MAQGQLAEALTFLREGLAISRRLAKADSRNVRFQLDVSMFCLKVGRVLAAQGNFAEALASYRDSLAVRVWLATVDPNPTFQSALAMTHGIVALAYRDIGKPA